jgi:hypothetical protein
MQLIKVTGYIKIIYYYIVVIIKINLWKSKDFLLLTG